MNIGENNYYVGFYIKITIKFDIIYICSEKRKMRNKIEYIVGMLILTLGICLIVIADVGTSPWDSVSLGFVQIYGLNLGQWTFIVGVILVLITSLIQSSLIRTKVNNQILTFFFFSSVQSTDEISELL
jgi:uncharacterized membrane protein YczE